MKTKAQRQAWWNTLSDEEREGYISGLQAKKAKERRKRLIKASKGLQYNCKLCIHKLTQSCPDSIRDGCSYFYDTEREIMGPAYKRTA